MELKHKPSILELLACDSLKGSLREALRYLLDYIYQNSAIKQLPVPKVDETVLILDILIEYNYLRTYKASYAENLYNLIRLNRKTGANLDNHLPSLLALTLIPYIKNKLDKHFESLYYKPDRSADEMKKIRLYRLFSRSCQFVNLLCLVRSAAGKSDYHNFTDALLNIKLMGRTNSDNEHLTSSTFDTYSKVVADFMGHALNVGSYAIQFLDYWNTRNNSAPLFNASLPIPPSPSTGELGNSTDQTIPYSDDRSSNLCLICSHVRQNECALSNTGYVYCYSCLQGYVKTKQRCPVTNHPTSLDNIVKLYSNSNSYGNNNNNNNN